jgi:hypothetical protein
MSDVKEHLMSAGERAAYANGWEAREPEVEALKASVKTLDDRLLQLELEYGWSTSLCCALPGKHP